MALALPENTHRRLPEDRLQRSVGEASLVFEARPPTARTRLIRRFQQSPMRILTPREDRLEALAVLLNTTGGVCSGDRLRLDARVAEGAAATVTTQAAERFYRALAVPARVDQTLRIDRGARLHWAPQESILFDGCALERRIRVDASRDARFLAAETLVFGRRAMGERIRSLSLRDDWRIYREGRLAHVERFRIRPDEAREILDAPAGLGGHDAVATVLVQAPDGDALCERLQPTLPDDATLRGAATLVSGLLVVRLLGSATALRARLTTLLEELRRSALGFDDGLPRVWSC